MKAEGATVVTFAVCPIELILAQSYAKKYYPLLSQHLRIVLYNCIELIFFF